MVPFHVQVSISVQNELSPLFTFYMIFANTHSILADLVCISSVMSPILASTNASTNSSCLRHTSNLITYNLILHQTLKLFLAWIPHQTLSFSFFHSFIQHLFPVHNILDSMLGSGETD